MRKISCLYCFALLMFLNGCSTLKYGKANDYLQGEQYEQAIAEYEDALSRASNNRDVMLIANNLAYSYQLNGDFEKASRYYHKSIDAWPERGYYGFIGLAGLNYQFGKISEAHQSSSKARALVESPRYYQLENRSAYNPETVKRQTIAQDEFYKMRLAFRNLNQSYEVGDYKKSVQIAEKLLAQKYPINFGISFADNTVEEVEEGSMAQMNGLVKGDRLIEMDHREISGGVAAYDAINRYFDEYGAEVQIKIVRKGREIPILCRLSYPEMDQARTILRDARARLADRGNNTRKKEFGGPWLRVLEPKSARGVKIVAKSNVIFAILASAKDGVRTVTLNGVTCAASEASELEKSMLPGKVMKFTMTMPLAQGNNRFVLTAVDSRGNSARQQVEIDGNQSQARESDRIYDHRIAVVIGINKYRSFTPLEFAVNDARSVRERLEKMGFDKIIEVYDQEATRARIMRILADDLPGTMGKNDALMVYFAGHGLTEPLPDGGQEGYIAPADIDEKNYRGTAISMTSIHGMIKKYRAKHILFVFDSCYSGLGLKRSGGVNKTSSAFIKNASLQRAVQIITAGGKDEQAREEKGHGLFTKALLDSLSSKTVDSRDGFIVASDAAQFIRKWVTEKTNGEQNPGYGWLAGEGDFIFETE